MRPHFSTKVLTLTKSLNPTMIRYGPLKVVVKDWGTEYWLTNESNYCTKLLVVKPGWKSSLHFHRKKSETFLVLAGSCNLVLGNEKMRLLVGATVTIPAEICHMFSVFYSDPVCKILEMSMHHDDADVVRLEPTAKLPKGVSKRNAFGAR